ncbi:MAG: sporulation initiation factor Spo0A C-terminal domain-containing protein [Clostridia bacterium]
MEKLITEYLLRLGFVPNKLGYRYLFDIIKSALYDIEILPLKYVGYVELSKKYNKSISAIEKDVQNAISTAWLKGDVQALYDEFGETIDMKKGKPSNKQFILTALMSLKCRAGELSNNIM